MSSNGPKIDGPAVHRAAVEHAHELGDAAVAQARAAKDALGLPEAPVSPNAPPPYPAPPYPAPPYPRRADAPAAPIPAQEPVAQDAPVPSQEPAQEFAQEPAQEPAPT